MIYDRSPVNLNVTNMNGTRVSPSVEEEFLFVCVVEGDPRPRVSWYKAGILWGTPDTLRERSFLPLLDPRRCINKLPALSLFILLFIPDTRTESW